MDSKVFGKVFFDKKKKSFDNLHEKTSMEEGQTRELHYNITKSLSSLSRTHTREKEIGRVIC